MCEYPFLTGASGGAPRGPASCCGTRSSAAQPSCCQATITREDPSRIRRRRLGLGDFRHAACDFRPRPSSGSPVKKQRCRQATGARRRAKASFPTPRPGQGATRCLHLRLNVVPLAGSGSVMTMLIGLAQPPFRVNHARTALTGDSSARRDDLSARRLTSGRERVAARQPVAGWRRQIKNT
jgi:hypothetical protein